MKWLLCVWMVLAWVSCVGVRPPKRPVAYIYPSVHTMAVISSLKPIQATMEDLRETLKRGEVYVDLMNAGLQEMDLDIVLRGLAKHGYAEIDARQCKGRVKLVAVYHGNDGLALDVVWR